MAFNGWFRGKFRIACFSRASSYEGDDDELDLCGDVFVWKEGLTFLINPMLAARVHARFGDGVDYPPVAKPGYRVMPPSTKMLAPVI